MCGSSINYDYSLNAVFVANCDTVTVDRACILHVRTCFTFTRYAPTLAHARSRATLPIAVTGAVYQLEAPASTSILPTPLPTRNDEPRWARSTATVHANEVKPL